MFTRQDHKLQIAIINRIYFSLIIKAITSKSIINSPPWWVISKLIIFSIKIVWITSLITTFLQTIIIKWAITTYSIHQITTNNTISSPIVTIWTIAWWIITTRWCKITTWIIIITIRTTKTITWTVITKRKISNR